MEITNIVITLEKKSDSKLKATANITVDDCFMIRGVKIIKGMQGLFVAMPSKKAPSGAFRDMVHPTNAQTRKMFEAKVLAAYQKKWDEENKPRIIYYRQTNKRPDPGDTWLGSQQSYFLHFEGTDFTVTWDENNNFRIINLPVKISKLLEDEPSPAMDMGPPIETPDYLDPSGAVDMAITKADENHPLVKLIHQLVQCLEQKEKITKEILQQVNHLEIEILHF
ncbi:MAG: hypothetical protein A2Y67_01045 [Candidatus Buchananbacteria bacterium RBG_13_39_9]|uniref:Septation protein SpoVG n=1 Tax=Candidatus Buchananbacteria bacterium RBG_13_39_9 TaxID=1797531 RepID=A0A1G1XQT5_9BACT|nr:MAG: hypothetical protein A2Y67_01045 [Candidatus Buchananbacteria bacterium RBG_13_39_9]